MTTQAASTHPSSSGLTAIPSAVVASPPRDVEPEPECLLLPYGVKTSHGVNTSHGVKTSHGVALRRLSLQLLVTIMLTRDLA